jgi:hypothetical protein
MAGRGSSCIAWLALGSDRSSSSHLQLLLLLELQWVLLLRGGSPRVGLLA